MTSADLRANPDNFCYRHPDRQSFVLCQRCLRTICPECQTQLPVGVICPECLAEQRAEQQANLKQTRARMPRARVGSGARSGAPIVTYILMGITSAFYLLGLIPGFGATLQSLLAYWPPLSFAQPWRLLTVTLVHASPWHIVLNMLSLWALGRVLEPLLGRWRYLALYVLSALGGSVLTALIAPNIVVVGASGAIWGLLGAVFVVGRHLGANVTPIAILLVLNLVLTFLPGSNIAWQAHIGGGLTGALIGFVFARTRAIRQQRTQVWLLVAVGVGLVALLGVSAAVYGW